MDSKSMFFLVIGFIGVSFLLIIVFLILIFKMAKKEAKRREEIKINTPKHRFEYVDFFFYHTISYGKEHTSTYGYFVIRDIDTSIMYCIHNRNANVSFSFVSMFNTKKMELFLNTPIKKNIKFNDKGVFWIANELNNDFYVRNDEKVKIDNVTFKYAGNIENVENISKYNVLYNLNTMYDISLLDNATFINGIVEFDIED